MLLKKGGRLILEIGFDQKLIKLSIIKKEKYFIKQCN